VALFQKTVLKEFVKIQNQVLIQEAFAKFQAHFGDLTIQQNIREAKEEQYQEGFLKDLFVDILGYTLAPQPNFNLITEQKNENDSKKADAAILKDEKVVGVVELKSTKTFDLQSIELQAFSYKNAHQNCRYVVTSNFQKLRFYLDNTIEYEDFDLFALDLERFKVLYTLLHHKNIAKDLPIDLKQKSIQREQEITLAFYNDYEAFRESLFKNIAHLNRQYNKFLLFQKTQKLLDRIVFMCFAEDKGLLPANLIHTIVREWEVRKEEGDKVMLYDRFKAHFEFINTGFQSTKYDIYPYNGGLFAYDEVLDNLQIDDKNLRSRSEGLSSYDFDSDIDVNVLGHIFEHSLNQLEKKRAELIEDIENEKNGTKKENKNTTQRKTDGIFYTPLYITNYIIEETLGKLCAEKKQALDWDNLTIEKINEYRDWLLTIKVLDPACGSGAFLNQVLNFFINEHQKIDEWASILSQTKVSFDFTHQILENNIFGVDINFESVSITKLSLWLRIAQDKRKLNDLSENIKQGNSLIDDKSVDERAFEWKKEFPKAKEGFDLIVGNPPYGAYLKPAIKKQLQKYDSLVPDFESYYYFISRGLELLNATGQISYIIPNTFLANQFGQKFRTRLLENHTIMAISDLSELKVFDEAQVRTCIFIIGKGKREFLTKFSTYSSDEEKINTDKYLNENYLTDNLQNWLTLFSVSKEVNNILKNIKQGKKSVGDFCEVSQGLIPYDKYRGHDEHTIKNRIWHSTAKKDDTYKKELKGADINRYFYDWNGELWISYGEWLGAPRQPKFFTQPRILVREIAENSLTATYIEEEYYNTGSLINIIQQNNEVDLKYLLAILNSKLMGWYHYNTSPKAKKGLFPKILISDVRKIPIPLISQDEQKTFITKVNRLLSLHEQVYKYQEDFLNLLKSSVNKTKLTQKIEKWYRLDWNEFAKELEKSKIKLSLPKQKEWLGFLREEKLKVVPLDDEIQQLEKQLDTLVYKLYDLTEEEIKIVENG
jgi:hypothetical protein